jgi:hypothetical protein
MNLEMISEVDFKWWSIMALIHSSSQCQLKAKKRKNIPPPAPYTNGSFFQLSLLWGQMKPYRFGIELIPSKFIRNNLSKKGKKLRISITTCFLNITKSKMRKKRQNQMPISTSIFKNTLQIFENLWIITAKFILFQKLKIFQKQFRNKKLNHSKNLRSS